MANVTAPLPVRPDISYTPDLAKYQVRIKRRHALEKLETSLPEGFPAQLESKLVWEGQSLAESYNWNYELTGSDIEEIEAALHHFQCT